MKWSMRLRVARQAGLMDAMMERSDVDQLALMRENRGKSFASARRTCLDCRRDRDCAHWLHSAPPAEAAPGFCSNMALFARFRKTRSLIPNS
jgi:hypothetical protein